MTVNRAFAPKTMKLSVLTAALQELTPRARRDADPDLAIEEWLGFSRDIGSPYIQLSAALHPSVSDVPAGIDKAKSRTLLENANTLGFIDKALD